MRKSWLTLPAFFLLALHAQPPSPSPDSPPAPAATPAPTQPAAAPPAAAPAAPVPEVNPLKPTPEVLAKAKKLYGYDCAMCHGAAGDGKGDLVADMKLTLKDFTSPAALQDLSDSQIYAIIRDGKGQMTGEGNRAKPADIWGLVLLVRSFSK